MQKRGFSLLSICVVIILLCGASKIYSQSTSAISDYTDSIVFNFTGAPQTWVVPQGINQIHVDACGAQGGSELGGKGGRVQSDLKVLPGSSITITVGSQPESTKGGYNGGGKGCGNGTGGGGASDIRVNGTGLDARVLVAGGGGGKGFNGFAGDGGGLTGGFGGYDSTTEHHFAKGGTQDAGGAGATVYYSPAGKAGKGGDGISSRGKCINDGMGGGGGGYYGGGGSGAGGGGGGSSYTDKNNTNVTHEQGVRKGNGKVVLYWMKKKK